MQPKRLIWAELSLVSALIFSGCATKGGSRPYYERNAGAYLSPYPQREKTEDKLGSASSSATELERVAKSYIGTPYRYGGTNSNGFDCSGYIKTVYKNTYGIHLPHSSSALYQLGQPVSKSDLQTGDLVFFGKGWRITHSGIYLRNGLFLHASSSKGISQASLANTYFKTRYRGARRIID